MYECSSTKKQTCYEICKCCTQFQENHIPLWKQSNVSRQVSPIFHIKKMIRWWSIGNNLVPKHFLLIVELPCESSDDEPSVNVSQNLGLTFSRCSISAVPLNIHTWAYLWRSVSHLLMVILMLKELLAKTSWFWMTKEQGWPMKIKMAIARRHRTTYEAIWQRPM